MKTHIVRPKGVVVQATRQTYNLVRPSDKTSYLAIFDKNVVSAGTLGRPQPSTTEFIWQWGDEVDLAWGDNEVIEQ